MNLPALLHAGTGAWYLDLGLNGQENVHGFGLLLHKDAGVLVDKTAAHQHLDRRVCGSDVELSRPRHLPAHPLDIHALGGHEVPVHHAVEDRLHRSALEAQLVDL